MHEGSALFRFQSVVAESVTAFDQAKVRAVHQPIVATRRGWVDPHLVVQVRVARVGVVTFTFGVKLGGGGELVWGTMTPTWPPRDGSQRMNIVNDVLAVVKECLSRFPEIGISPDIVTHVGDLGTYYDVTGSIQAVPHKKPQSKTRSKAKKAVVHNIKPVQGVRICLPSLLP